MASLSNTISFLKKTFRHFYTLEPYFQLLEQYKNMLKPSEAEPRVISVVHYGHLDIMIDRVQLHCEVLFMFMFIDQSVQDFANLRSQKRTQNHANRVIRRFGIPRIRTETLFDSRAWITGTAKKVTCTNKHHRERQFRAILNRADSSSFLQNQSINQSQKKKIPQVASQISKKKKKTAVESSVFGRDEKIKKKTEWNPEQTVQ